MGARTRGLANNVLTSGKLDATDAISGVIPASNIANGSLTSATTYGSITGGVPAVSSDPPSPSEGDVWYNTRTGRLRFVAKLGAWASGGALNTARKAVAGVGIQTAGLAFGGTSDPPVQALTESYNGSTWTEVGDLNAARSAMGNAGTNTSALGFCGPPGSTPTANESWNGSAWTEVGDLNTFRGTPGGAGANNTAALAFGGGVPSGPEKSALCEDWNGSSWTEVGDLNTARANHAGTGKLKTAALCIGGSGDPDGTESWNGSSWTAVANINNGRINLRGAGTYTSAIVFGGAETITHTESWNGSAWTEVGNLAQGRKNCGGAGADNTSGLAFGGESGPPGASITDNEEWTLANTNFDVG